MSLAFNITNKRLDRQWSANKQEVGRSNNTDPCEVEWQAKSSQRSWSPYIGKRFKYREGRPWANTYDPYTESRRKQHHIDYMDNLVETH